MESVEEDIYWTKVKADSGVDYFVTQMFFDAEVYKVFVDRARAAGIEQPIIPGIKPLTIYKHLSILPKIFGCHIPKELRERVEKHKESKEDIRKVGVEWCVEQCHKLEEYGAPSLHFYAARKAPIKQIIEAL